MITKDDGADLSRSNQLTQASGCQHKCLVESTCYCPVQEPFRISSIRPTKTFLYLWHYPPRLGNFKMSSFFSRNSFLSMCIDRVPGTVLVV
jgi:hypothetical protein